MSGTYLPVAGDFDGDGKDEIFWYGPGATADSLWNFTSRTSHTSSTRTVSGSNFIPVAGDFDGDHKADILFNNWTTDGGDTIWWGDTVDGSSQKYVSLAIARLPFASDFDGDGKSDLFVNRYSAGGDTIWWGAAKTNFGTNSDDIGFEASSTTLDATYSYGIDGMRSAKTVNSGTEPQFTWNDANGLPTLLAETQGSDTTYLIYGPGDQPIEQIDPAGTAQWLHHDQLGSVRLTTHATDGTHASDRRFNAYGTTADANGTQPLLDYAGQHTDTETGYQYLRARYYDPTTGQFVTPDPLYALTDERYGYAANDPVNGSDPTGLWCVVHNDNGGCLGSGVAKSVAHGAKEGLTHVVNGASGVDFVALAYGEITSGGHCYPRGGRIECDGAWGAGGRPWTFGDVVMNTSSSRMSDERFGHESKHSTQWAAFGGWGFIPVYLLDLAIEGRCNSFEHEAGYTSGGYNDPPNPCQPGHQSSSPCPAGGHHSTDPH